MNPAAALTERFAADLAACLAQTGAEPHAAPLAVAVSGGADSMALLALAAVRRPVIAATVDHGLRAESADEAAMVARWCAGAGIAHHRLQPATPRAAGENLHDWARRERYAALGAWARGAGAAALLTAHHADDQAETFLMRAARGAGVAGLAGVRAAVWIETGAQPLRLVRPLLGWRRAELRALAERLALPFVDDPSNDDARFARARFRALLAETPLLDIPGLARAALHAAEADAALDTLAEAAWNERCDDAHEISVPVASRPRELCRRLARRAVEAVRARHAITTPEFSPATNVEPLLDALVAGTTATQSGVLASARGGWWHFRPAPPRRASGGSG